MRDETAHKFVNLEGSFRYKCPHCGWVYKVTESDDGLVPYHNFPRPLSRRVCPGAKQTPRGLADRRPLWIEENSDQKLEREVYAEMKESEEKMKKELDADIEKYSFSLQDAIKHFQQDMSYTEYLGIVSSREVTGESQGSDYGFDHEYVDQPDGGGITGDEFSGHIYFPVTETEYMKFLYSC